jgi:hypothetical protein
MQVSDEDIKRTLLYEFGAAKAYRYACRIASQNGPFADQYARVAAMLHVPYGRCPKHREQVVSNGMFDAPCPICEAQNEQY